MPTRKLFLWFLCLSACMGYTHGSALETVDIPSPSMNTSLPAAVVLPESYAETDHSYPVIYLLHGAFGDHRDWLDKVAPDGLVQSLANQYNIIFVLPEGGTFSFYLDSPVLENSRYETHITAEVVPFVDEHYRTVADPAGRAITGLSMGGQGALYLATRHPHLFGAAGSMSGAVHMDINGWDLPEEDIDRLMQGFMRSLGNDIEPEFLAKNSVSNMVDQIKANNIPIIIDCGVDDFLIDANRKFHKRLLENKVPHDYIERPGRHNWPYWQNALLYQVLFISEVFRENGSMVSL
ncbi:MAG: esterase family protein [Bacteroidia bacterium]|nr:MAG: esterase family protein [Bacteroidia bacterium]